MARVSEHISAGASGGIRIEQELGKKNALLQLLQRVAVAANEATAVDEVLQFVLDQVCAYTAWPVGHVYLQDREAPGRLIPTGFWHGDRPERFEALQKATAATPLSVGSGLPGRVLARRAPVWISDVAADPNFPRARLAADLGVKAAFAFPVMVGKEVVAVLEFFSARAMEPDASFLEVMASIGTQLGRVVERSRAEALLRDSEERLRALTESAIDAIVTADQAGLICDWNRGAQDLFGYSREEVLGCSLKILMPPRYAAAHERGMARARQGGRRRLVGRTVELHGVRKGGAEFPLELSLSQWRAGEETYYTGIMRDITERKRAEEEIRRLNRELEGRVHTRTEELLWSAQALEAKHRALEQEMAVREGLEASLRQEKDFAESVINSLPGIFYLFDEEGRMLRWNRNVELLTSYAADEIAAMHPLAFVEEKELAAERIRMVFVEGHATLEGHLVAKDGRRIPFFFTGIRFTSEGRNYLLGVGIDITARRQAEEALKRAKEAAEAAQQRSAFLAEVSGVLAFTLDYELTLRNVAALMVPRFADWCAVDVAGTDGALEQVAVAHVGPEQDDRVRALRRQDPPDPEAPLEAVRVLRTGQPLFWPAASEDQLRTVVRDASHLDLLRQAGSGSVMIVPMRIRGVILGTITFVRAGAERFYTEADLGLAEELAHHAAMEIDNARLFKETQRLYREAEQARWQAEEMSRLKSSFLANMSHEIRTPLTSIVGFASLLATRVPEQERAFAHRIEAGGRRLMETLTAVLALAQLEANRTVLQREPLDVVEEVCQVLERMEGRARQKQLDLQFKAASQDGRIRAHLDRGAFASIIQNLVDNAIKFTEGGSVVVTVEEDAARVYLHVEDTGKGIDEAFLPYLFEDFRQESKGWSRSHEGAGLGLSITKRLVEKMGGRIEAQSQRGGGSRFTVSFPRAADEEKTPPGAEPRGTAGEAGRAPGPARILVVEDNQDTQFFMRTLLEDVGSVTVAGNAEEALRAARQPLEETARKPKEGAAPPGAFDLVLVDINLGPGKDGTDVLAELRALPAYRNVPFAAVTAYALPGDRERLLSMGFDAYLAKPFYPAELLDLTSRLLGGSSARS